MCQAIDEDLPILVELWQKLCSAMLAAIQRTDIPSEHLIDFINACTQGAWYLRTAHKRTSGGNLFYKVCYLKFLMLLRFHLGVISGAH